MHYLITGGAGFIGCNYVHRLLARGERVAIFDNLSRQGCRANIAWLRSLFGGGAFDLVEADVRDRSAVGAATSGKDVVVHLAAQVAVTASVEDPDVDMAINILGTFNVLEAARQSSTKPIVLYASTNKVYGAMGDVPIIEKESRYVYRDVPEGIPESFPLDLHSPYGCSKGAGDQYVRDYARIYGLPTVVFRQSCIYGPRQFGVEDQGWVAWFMIAAMLGKRITIYGDGKQVRDILYIEDLLDAFDAAVRQIDRARGQIYNVGGGPQNSISVWREYGPLLEELLGYPVRPTYAGWRPGDQRIYVSNVGKASTELGWRPRIGIREGLTRLYDWIKANKHLFDRAYGANAS